MKITDSIMTELGFTKSREDEVYYKEGVSNNKYYYTFKEIKEMSLGNLVENLLKREHIITEREVKEDIRKAIGLAF